MPMTRSLEGMQQASARHLAVVILTEAELGKNDPDYRKLSYETRIFTARDLLSYNARRFFMASRHDWRYVSHMLTDKFGDREKMKDWGYFVTLANSRKHQNEPLDPIFNRFFAEDAYNFEP